MKPARTPLAETSYRTWKRLAPVGLATVGFGASLLGEAIIQKAQGASTGRWFAVGTLSLCVLNAGLCCFGEAVKHRALYDWEGRQAAKAPTRPAETPGVPTNGEDV